ncbi:MAG: hypothetical protein ACJ8GW_19055 [Massilia sp.]
MRARAMIMWAALLDWAVGAQASTTRVGALEVRLGSAGTPCFTISEAEERRGGVPEFLSISVAQSWPGAKAVVWSMAMPGTRSFPMSFRMCIPYAGRVPVLPQTPAAPLVSGRPYEVMIAVRAAPAPGAPRSYRARFCVRGEPPTSVRTLAAAQSTCGD